MNKKAKMLLIIIPIIIFSIVLIYLLFFNKKDTNEFYSKTILVSNLDGNKEFNVSKLSTKEASTKVKEDFYSTTINLYENDKIVDSIPIKNFSNLKENIEEEIIEAKKQNDKLTLFEKLKTNKYSLHINYSITNDDLSKLLDTLNCIKTFKESKDAYIEKIDNELVIQEEVYGNEIDKDLFIKNVVNEINKGNVNINLDDLNIYIKPKTLKNDVNLKKQVESYNKCINTKFTYLFGKYKEVISKDMISSWISFNEKNEITFDEDSMLEYISSLATKYNTYGTTRTFTTTNGQTIKIPAGDYGWSISQTKEVENLKNDLLKGETIEREPTWLYVGYGSYTNQNGLDIGDSYIEINISSQHLWLYVDGDLKLESDFVSGNESKGHGTPSGVFGLTYKTKNATLKGPGYATPVSYWMPFNRDIGLHDATWRNSFGGKIYKTSGSHGCINLPKEKAKEIYNYIDTYFPIIVYDEEELNTKV